MVNQLILSVAGAGKTTRILNAITQDRRSLVVTYTNENYLGLQREIRRKFGCIPSNVTVLTYFSFLYAFCFRPFWSYALRDRAFNFNGAPRLYGRAAKKDHIEHYLDQSGYLYNNRVAKFLLQFETIPKIVERIDTFFDQVLVDEVQDLASYDFELMLKLSASDSDFLFVGDYFQHTFDTSRDGPKNKNLYKNGLEEFIKRFTACDFLDDRVSLKRTYRCSQSVAAFISDNLGIPIESHRLDNTTVEIIDDKKRTLEIFNDDAVVKLFYQDHAKYPCHSNNWGRCKGRNDYNDVCVVLNTKSHTALLGGRVSSLPESTRNKLYVACSRANGALYFVNEAHLKSLKNSR